MGSVKDLEVLVEPRDLSSGKGIFVFSDRFSVFDWGVMPDLIEGKGKAICVIGAWFFEKLEELGVRTHYIGVLDDGKVKKVSEVSSPPSKMVIKLLRVVRPRQSQNGYDYSELRTVKGNFVIPLEVIYRNSLPRGSSVFKRLREGSLSLQDLGLDDFPRENTKLKKPFVDFSTKFESQDRYLSPKEAKEIAGLSEEEFEEIKRMVLLANKLISDSVGRLGILNDDGKIEFGFDEERKLIFVDVLGTPDECRFTYKGVHISKEVLRSYYRKTDWYERIVEAKAKDPVEWRKFVDRVPPTLPLELKRLVSEMYMSLCNSITERDWFKVRDFSDVVNDIRSYLT